MFPVAFLTYFINIRPVPNDSQICPCGSDKLLRLGWRFFTSKNCDGTDTGGERGYHFQGNERL